MKQWKLSWEMWPHEWDKPHVITKVHDVEAEALDHLKGLQSMLADHEPRPCGKHVWDIKMEIRETGEWEQAAGGSAAAVKENK